ncbi:MAG: type II secretion system protein [Planctomycetes bacterium]|nr:type II secretion system protein [Planctomycetota bacterium]
MKRTPESAFTLVELLIVVVILGIIAAVAIPQFTNSTEDARTSSLQSNLSVLRNAMEYYKMQHLGKYPGYPSGGGAPTAAATSNQLLQASKPDGSTAALGTAGFTLGPYIKEQLPANPVNGLNTVTVVADGAAFPAADDSTGWIYQPQIGKIRANSTGRSPAGQNYYDY